MTLLKYFSFIIILFIATSCTYNPLDVDASHVKVNIKYINMDSILVNSDSAQLIKAHHFFQEEIPHLYDYQLGYCLGIGKISDTGFYNSYQKFKNDPYIIELEKEISKRFNNVSKYKTEINSAFQHLKYHLPKVKIPENVVFMNSFFATNAFATETEIGIGLERYLSPKTKVIQQLPSDQFYQWMKDMFDEKYLVRDALCAWIMTHSLEDTKGNLAEQFIYWGKILYLTEAALPHEKQEIILRYTDKDLQWAIENEYSIWKHLVEDKMLFKIDERLNMNFLKEGPFTAGLDEVSPDRLGQFMGWRMVHKYMEIKKCSVEELIKTPFTAILSEYEIE